MIPRRAFLAVQRALGRQAAVAILGPRQIGKTTLAHEIAGDLDALYLDLESRRDRARLAEPTLFLGPHEDRLVILDEIHRVPELFQELRGIIDQGRRAGRRHGRFLVLGSASMDLMRQSGESLAGRIEYVELHALDVLEAARDAASADLLWLRGGFPDSLLASTDEDSFAYRRNLIRTYLERDVPQFGFRIAAERLERFWTMLAHGQGALLNASTLAASLSVSAPTVTAYVDLLADLLLVRRLTPWRANVRKRLVKSPKVYVRDSGLVHTLLGIEDLHQLAGHPIAGASWEGFVIENLLAAAPPLTQAGFYRTARGAEVDLVLQLPGANGLWAIEIKRTAAPAPARGFYSALEDLEPGRSFIVHAGEGRYPIAHGIEAIGLRDLAAALLPAGGTSGKLSMEDDG